MEFTHVLSSCPRTSFCSVGRSTAHTDSRHGPLQEEQGSKDSLTPTHTRTTGPRAAHGMPMKTSSTPSSRATSSSFSVRHICRVLVTACRALSSLHSRHTLGMSCSEGGEQEE